MKLLSWNVRWCRAIDGRVDPAHIAHEARRLADADVLCMQELADNFASLTGSRGEDQIAALAREFPDHVHVFAWGVDVPDPGRHGRRSRFGNLVLSRLPLGRVLRHSLPRPAATATPSMPRVALEVLVEAPFGPLRVITTHLEYYASTHRAAQIERLREPHAEACARAAAQPSDKYADGPFRHLPDSASAVVTGDFNLAPQDPLYARIQAPFDDGTPRLVDAWRALHPHAPNPPTFRLHDAERGETPYCCDYAFVTEDLVPRLAAMRIDPATQASDHQPVILELSS